MAIKTDLDVFQGTDKQFAFEIVNDAETAALDITGWALSWMVKWHKNDADSLALVTKTTGAGIVIAGTFNSTIGVNTQTATVTLEDTDSTTLYEGWYHHELKRTDPGFETVLSYGGFSLVQGVHR